MFLIKLTTAVGVAWTLFVDWAMPKKIDEACHDFDAQESGELVAVACPIAGVLFGVALFIGSGILQMLFGGHAGAVLFAILAMVAMEAKDYGRSAATVISGVSAVFEEHSLSGGLGRLSRNFRSLNGIIPTLVSIGYLGVKFASLLVIAYLKPEWIIAVMVLAFSAQGYLASIPSISSGEAILEVADSAKFHLWLVAIFIMLFFIAAPVAPLFSLLFAAGGSWWFGNYCLDEFGSVDSGLITLFGAVIEFLVLFIGALALL